MNESKNIKCPVCLDTDGSECKRHQGASPWYDCCVCGLYEMDMDLDFQIQSNAYGIGKWELNGEQRSILSHDICVYNIDNCEKIKRNEAKIFHITTDMLDSIRTKRKLPILMEQAENLFRYIGNNESQSEGYGVEVPVYKIHAIIGSKNHIHASELIKELKEKGYIKGNSTSQRHILNLTIEGSEWNKGLDKNEEKGKIGFDTDESD